MSSGVREPAHQLANLARARGKALLPANRTVPLRRGEVAQVRGRFLAPVFAAAQPGISHPMEVCQVERVPKEKNVDEKLAIPGLTQTKMARQN